MGPWLRRNAKVWLGLLGTGVFLGLFFASAHPRELWDVLSRGDYRWAVAAVALWFVAAWFRALRWGYLLRHLARISTLSLYPVVVIGYMANNLLPVRLGELVRTYILGERQQLPKMAVLGTVAVERVLDGLVLVAMLAFAGALVGLQGSLRLLTVAAAGLLVTAFLLGLWLTATDWGTRLLTHPLRLLPERWQARAADYLASFVEGLAALRSPLVLGVVALVSGVAWLLEGAMYYLVGRAFQVGEPFAVYLVLAGAANLAIIIPSTAGGVGPFEWASRRVLVAAGVGSATASAYAVALHGLLLVPVIAAGLLFLWGMNLPLGQLFRKERVPAAVETAE